MADYLDLDLADVSKKLQSSASWTRPEGSVDGGSFEWMGHPLGEDVRTEGLDTYHGDFRKRSLGHADCGCH